MQNINTIEAQLVAPQGDIYLIVGRFNSFISESLLQGAVDTLLRHGVEQSSINIVRVPGAFEMPLIAKKIAATKKAAAIIALGAVIRGGTPHFDYVAGECTKGLAQVSLDAGVPIGFGVLTVDSIEQAIERAGTKMGNKGEEAALSIIEMMGLCQQL